MFFKGRRIRKLAETLWEHVKWIETLRHNRLTHLTDAVRMGELSDFDRRRVLALNYELASHAARGLTLIRQLDEIGGFPDADTRDQVMTLRHAFRQLEDLPGVPRRDCDQLPLSQLDDLWKRFVANREVFTREERMALLELDMATVADEGVFLNVGEGLTPSEAREAQARMADVLREVDWDEIVRRKTEGSEG